MAVAVSTSPDEYALTKGGRMRYSFVGNGRVVTGGSYAVNAINFPGLPVPDNTRFILRWGGRTVEVVAKTTPVAVNEIPAGDGGAAYVASLLEFFQEYFPFREDFTVSLDSIGGSNSLIFEANKPGPAYNFSPADALPVVANIDPRFVASNPLTRERYSVYVELYLQKPGTPGTAPAHFERITSSVLDTDDDGVCDIDAGELLHARLSAELPAWNRTGANVCDLSHRRYYISYGEAYGSPLVIGRVKNDTIRQAYLGGADYVHRAGAGFDLMAFTKGISQTEDKALRLGGTTRYVSTGEPQFLTFINTRSPVEAALRIRLIFDNGTGLTVTNAIPDFTFGTGDKWTLPVGLSQLALLNLVPLGRTLSEYSVRLTTGTPERAASDPNGNLHLSVEYRYVLSGAYEPYVRHFAYLNSLGALDTLTTYGKGSHELNRFYEQAERILPAQYLIESGHLLDYDVAVQQQVEVATGFRPKKDLQYWNDFYRSPLRLRLRQTGAAWSVLPIGLLSKSIKQAKDGDTLFAHKFEYAYLFRDDFFTATEDTEAGDGVPPTTFVPQGQVIITQPTVINAVDPTVPAAARELTLPDLSFLRFSKAAGLHTNQGYLTQAVIDGLYMRQDQPIDYRNLANKPTTRDEAGLSDVPTVRETRSHALQVIARSVRIRTRLASWTTDFEPQQS